MNKSESISNGSASFNCNVIQLSELGSLKQNKSDRIYLPSEPSKKIKNYFNSYNFCLDNIDNTTNRENNNSLNSSSMDSFADNSSTHDEESEDKQNELTPQNHHKIDDLLQQNTMHYEDEQMRYPVKLKSDIHISSEGHCINYEDRNYSNVFSEENQNVSMIIGYVCIAFGAVLFCSTLFSLFFAPFLQPSTHIVIEFLRTDNFYCFLIPLSIPVLIITIYMNWVSMKYFKHS